MYQLVWEYYLAFTAHLAAQGTVSLGYVERPPDRSVQSR